MNAESWGSEITEKVSDQGKHLLQSNRSLLASPCFRLPPPLFHFPLLRSPVCPVVHSPLSFPFSVESDRRGRPERSKVHSTEFAGHLIAETGMTPGIVTAWKIELCHDLFTSLHLISLHFTSTSLFRSSQFLTHNRTRWLRNEECMKEFGK